MRPCPAHRTRVSWQDFRPCIRGEALAMVERHDGNPGSHAGPHTRYLKSVVRHYLP